mmetsp:Transcript_9712/g.16350  ORF Transcript_9712/g.16350 Transcript_9712/m.16350 type:complete len:90 (+) Transcript_9712:580-849(+)|eukprot:CAMPEP_0168613308 /NCGR_PEP_ID=MMETSP0449_2-20121227/3383_1 /TAXON_ID=1082188 /ORGANISM="Strombidium rassoulzadegani, Strain ras09" /LENGTH=89 /DNA_ID=CAMNT_0008653935 /DNA_START=515 /DNA_END=784 /DNA_ORIENTATION=+
MEGESRSSIERKKRQKKKKRQQREATKKMESSLKVQLAKYRAFMFNQRFKNDKIVDKNFKRTIELKYGDIPADRKVNRTNAKLIFEIKE